MYWCWTDCSGTETPARRPTRRAHCPAQLTTMSAAIVPSAVTTPAARPRAVTMPVTGQSSTMRTPPWRAPLASAWAMSAGFGLPVGRQEGGADQVGHVHDRPQPLGLGRGQHRCISRPKLCAVVACRRISVSRSALQASRRPPFRFQPVAWPVSPSSRS